MAVEEKILRIIKDYAPKEAASQIAAMIRQKQREARSVMDVANNHNHSEIYCMYDALDGEIFCAFDNKERADLEHQECGAPYQVVKLHHGKRETNKQS